MGLLYALLVGYSRVYLAQHFPVDVAGGIVAAIISVYLSLKNSAKVGEEVSFVTGFCTNGIDCCVAHFSL